MHVDEENNFTREGVKLVVEEQDESLVITYAELSGEDTYHLAILLLDRLAGMTGQEYNQVLEDLKETENEV